MELHGITALVTGAAHRVGRAIALGLAEQGADIVLHFHSSGALGESTADEVRSRGVSVALVSGDLAADPAAVLDGAGDLGPVRVLVNNAAVFGEDRLGDVSRSEWDHTMAVNLVAPVFLTQEFARRLPADLSGVVVNITDWRTLRPYRDHFSYTVAKGGLDTFTRAAAEALAPQIRVNAVALGAILPPPGKDAAHLKALARDIPMARPGGTDPVVQAVLALLGNDYITGEIVRVDGGAHLR